MAHGSIPLLALLALPVACSWSRFDDLEHDAPVSIVERPDGVSGFADSVAAVSLEDHAFILATSSAGLQSLYDASSAGNPPEDPVVVRVCGPREQGASTDVCRGALRSVGLPRLTTPAGEERELCFAAGLGETSDGEPAVVVNCGGSEAVRFPVPRSAAQALGAAEATVVFAADRAELPSWGVASTDTGDVWVYPAGSGEFVEVAAGGRGGGFGATLAIYRDDAATFVAVGAPEAGEVQLFVVPDAAPVARPVACLAGGSRFGRSLAAGELRGDGELQLVVGSEDAVQVFTSALLADPDGEPGDCSAGASSDALVGEVRCADSEGEGAAACSADGYATDLALADFDADGADTLMIGVPGSDFAGERAAGAMHLYELSAAGTLERVGTGSLTRSRAGDGLGASISTFNLRSSVVPVAAVPGAGWFAMFYCLPLTPNDARLGRCR